jgi:hypothetical protein
MMNNKRWTTNNDQRTMDLRRWMMDDNIIIKQNAVEGEGNGGGDGDDGELGECEGTMVDAASKMTRTRRGRGQL